MEDHHDENSRRTRKSFQWIQEEDRGTLRNDEEGACHGVCQVATGEEEGKQRDVESESEANEEVEAKHQGLKIKIEEMLALMKEMHRGQKEKEEVKARKDDEHSGAHEVAHPNEPERMLKRMQQKNFPKSKPSLIKLRRRVG